MLVPVLFALGFFTAYLDSLEDFYRVLGFPVIFLQHIIEPVKPPYSVSPVFQRSIPPRLQGNSYVRTPDSRVSHL